MPSEPTSTPHWSDALDTSRALATVMVVMLHSAIPYAQGQLPLLRWHVYEPGSPRFDDVFWWCYAFATPLFSLLAGMLARGSIDRAGAFAFALARLKRLGVPLVVGTLVALPLTYLSWLRGWQLQGLADPVHPLRGNFAPGLEHSLWGFGHLWYIEYILLLALAAACLRAVLPPSAAPSDPVTTPSPLRRALAGPLVTGAIVMLSPGVLLDFTNSFAPDPAKLLYHASFYAAGWATFPHRDHLHSLTRFWWAALGLASVTFPFLRMLITSPRGGAEPFLGLAGALFTWSMIYSTLGLACRTPFLPSLRALAHASFSTYILHLPILAAIQLALMGSAWSPSVKLALGLAGTLAACITLHALLKRTRIGWTLGADPVKPRATASAAPLAPFHHPLGSE